MNVDARTVGRLAVELQAWSASPGGQRILGVLAAATTMDQTVLDGVLALGQLARDFTAWVASEEGRCFLQGGLRAVERMNREAEAPAVRH